MVWSLQETLEVAEYLVEWRDSDKGTFKGNNKVKKSLREREVGGKLVSDALTFTRLRLPHREMCSSSEEGGAVEV